MTHAHDLVVGAAKDRHRQKAGGPPHVDANVAQQRGMPAER
jgi:hypothetical protein